MSMPTVRVYTSPLCQPCKATKRVLDKAGVSYEEIDATDPAVADRLKSYGFTTSPVVEVELPDGVDRWDGLRLDRLAALVYLAGDGAA